MKLNNYFLAAAGRLYPLVMKSVFLAWPSLVSFVKRLLILSLVPSIFRRFFFSFSSSSTRAVSNAVAAFLIPLEPPGVGVDVLLRLAVALVDFSVGFGSLPASAASPFAAFFLRFFEPGAFFKECVRPCSASLCPRSMSCCLSASFVGRMGITLSGVYGSSH